MTVEIFTREQFEAALPVHEATGAALWDYVGLVRDEHVYHLPVANTNKRIVIRSSVKRGGKSALTGRDSIRLWVEYYYRKVGRWFPLGKLDRWTTREPGWEIRMTRKLRELYRLALEDSKAYNNRTSLINETETEGKTTNKQIKASLIKEGAGGRVDSLPALGGAERSSEPPPPGRSAFVPSRYQTAIFDFVKAGEGHGVVEAVAGSGKTTSIVEALQFTDESSDVAFVAFSKNIATELSRRAPSHVHVSTLHSLGYANVRAAFGEVEVEPRKVWRVLDDLLDGMAWREAEELRASATAVVRLVSLCKATSKEPTAENLEWIADRWNIEVNSSEKLVYGTTKQVYDKSLEATSVIDYDDMIFFCASGKVACEKFDYLFVDECQDLNQAQVAMVLRSVKEGGRVLGVGDHSQSVYGFRGADVDAIPNLVEALHATTLPLSITYRCPRSHVRLAQELVPRIEAAENAAEGVVDSISEAKFTDLVRPGDLVLCRCNAPLVAPAFELIRRGVKAVILGRDIGKGLITFVEKIQRKARVARVTSLNSTLAEVADYTRRETVKLIAAGKGGRAQALEDKQETILALSDGCRTVSELKRKIEEVFSDTREGIVFSSVHKAKGGEAERIFILRPDLMPHPRATRGWERQQERNIQYVALTRSKSELYFVN